jgi:CubicO group peptidase (beta-lactamase class C family)
VVYARGRRRCGEACGSLRSACADRALPSLAVSVIDEHGLEVARHKAGLSATYHVGSLTKLVAAIATFRLQEAGHLAVDDAVSDHLAWFPRDPGAGPVTVLDLLRHTSGLPRGRLYVTDPPVPALRDALVRAAAGGRSASAGRARYSNLGYMALGLVVEAAAGRPFADVVRACVVRPLGMQRTGFGPAPGSMTAPHCLRPFHVDSRSPIDYARMPLHAGPSAAMGLWSTPEDMARVAACLMNDGAHRGVQVLRADSVRALLAARSPETERGLIGPGFRVQRVSSGEVLFEHAEHFGHSASLLIVPGRGVAVVAMTNRGSAGPDLAAVSEEIARTRLGDGEVLPPRSLDAATGMAGVYVAHDGVELAVTARAGRWFASIDRERPRRLTYRGQRWFVKHGGRHGRLPFRLASTGASRPAFCAGTRVFRSVEAPAHEVPSSTRAYDGLAGIYRNAAVGRLAIFERSGALVLAYSPFDEVVLDPVSTESFVQRDGAFRGDAVDFDRASQTLHVGGLPFSFTGLQY